MHGTLTFKVSVLCTYGVDLLASTFSFFLVAFLWENWLVVPIVGVPEGEGQENLLSPFCS